jgi:hypothetical protein
MTSSQGTACVRCHKKIFLMKVNVSPTHATTLPIMHAKEALNIKAYVNPTFLKFNKIQTLAKSMLKSY